MISGHGQEFLVAIKAGEAHLVADINPELFELLTAGIEPVRENVAERDNLDVFALDHRAFGHVLGMIAGLG